MLDKIIGEVDKIVRTLFTPAVSSRPHPDSHIEETKLSSKEQKHSLGLMRVNHCGEICAQGLYQGQALTARDKSHQESFRHAALEEVEHLAWTRQRIIELGGRASILDPVFYVGSLAMGIGAGIVGDKWSLGFLAETERQVGAHLSGHLGELPANDKKSLAIIEQMRIDEAGHEKMAHDCGSVELPEPVKKAMAFTSKIMTSITYHI